LNPKIKDRLELPSTAQEQALKDLCIGCDEVAPELIGGLEKLKVQGKKTKWKSMRQALKSVWSKDRIKAISNRLSNFRDQLNLSVLVSLRWV
jgi:hypothetical protein